MDNSSKPTKKDELKVTGAEPQVDDDIYDLDDPDLQSKVIKKGPPAACSMTCRFLAFPNIGIDTTNSDISAYGTIIHECGDRLIMRVPQSQINHLSHIKQCWVTKYVPAYTECRITFEPLRGDPENSTRVIVQRMLNHRVTKPDGDIIGKGSTSGDDNVPDPDTRDGDSTSDDDDESGKEEYDDDGLYEMRRCVSLPSPADIAELKKMRWESRQDL